MMFDHVQPVVSTMNYERVNTMDWKRQAIVFGS